MRNTLAAQRALKAWAQRQDQPAKPLPARRLCRAGNPRSPPRQARQKRTKRSRRRRLTPPRHIRAQKTYGTAVLGCALCAARKSGIGPDDLDENLFLRAKQSRDAE